MRLMASKCLREQLADAKAEVQRLKTELKFSAMEDSEALQALCF